MGSVTLKTLVSEDIIFSFQQFQNKLMKLRMGGTALARFCPHFIPAKYVLYQLHSPKMTGYDSHMYIRSAA